jgi:uncharacterized pyridoxamine 5'-phosphate oxidase family protein
MTEANLDRANEIQKEIKLLNGHKVAVSSERRGLMWVEMHTSDIPVLKELSPMSEKNFKIFYLMAIDKRIADLQTEFESL